MVYGVTGLLSGGKSYTCVKYMVSHLAAGGVVCTNMDLNLSEISQVVRRPVEYLAERYYFIDMELELLKAENLDGDECHTLTPEIIASDLGIAVEHIRGAFPWSWPVGDRRGVGNRRVMVVIDEAGEWFTGLLDRKETARFTGWLRQSAKRGQDVYLIVQDPSILAKQGRVIVHRWQKVRNMAEWRIPGLGLPLPPPWCYEFHTFEFGSDGKGKPSKRIEMRDRRIWRCYETAAMFGESAKSAESENVSAYDKICDDPVKAVRGPDLFMHAQIMAATYAVVSLLVFIT